MDARRAENISSRLSSSSMSTSTPWWTGKKRGESNPLECYTSSIENKIPKSTESVKHNFCITCRWAACWLADLLIGPPTAFPLLGTGVPWVSLPGPTHPGRMMSHQSANPILLLCTGVLLRCTELSWGCTEHGCEMASMAVWTWQKGELIHVWGLVAVLLRQKPQNKDWNL